MTEEKYASINNDGTIIMGNLFCSDGHSYGRGHFAFSHMHSDHSIKLPKCLYNGQVYMTKPTRDLLEAINNENYGSDITNHPVKRQITTLDYGESKIVTGKNGIKEKITFYESNHILGASQVEILTNEDKKIVYSGDITSNDIPPENVFTLVVDSSHGHPKYNKYSDPESVERRFLDNIENVIHSGQTQPVVIHAHRGKLQEIMALVSSHKELDEFLFHTSDTDIRIVDVYRKYGFNIRQKILDEKSDESEVKRDSDWPFIQFTSSLYKKTYEINGKAHSIYLVDSIGYDQIVETKNTSIYATTSHADFDNLIKYVEKANPKYVIVDNYRTKQAYSLTKALEEKGFTVDFQPKLGS